MKTKLLSVIAILFFAAYQNATAQRACGSMEHLQMLINENPSLLQMRQEIENHTAQYVTNPTNGRAVITIPVVVHVVYNTTAENVSDAQIQSQMNVLNADFRKLNADIANTPGLFAGLTADVQVEFCLAQRDPAGNATNGITRTYTTRTSFSTNDYVKYNSTGGKDAWDRNQYLNMWVCDLGSYLGYAQFPGGPAATDGVVIDYAAFGTTGAAAAPFNKGRTATHEVGHWLNLYHIWGDDGNGCTGSDAVGDTPNQANENYGCPSYPTPSCSNTSDMYMNYMDYTDDACMYMFTSGQSARMNALLASGGSRYSLLSSQGCVPPSGGSACAVPSGLNASSVTTTTATLNWATVSGASSYNVQVKATSSSTWNSSSTASTSVNVTGLTAGTQYEFQVEAVCATASSGFSGSSIFTTASVATCTDVYESNNTTTTAKNITPGVAINALIGSSTDNDYFKFTTTSAARNIKVTLTNLAADYDLVLYDSRGRKLKQSVNSGTASETLSYNTSKTGTYYVRVYGYNGAFSTTQCYNLLVQTSSSSLKGSEDLQIDDAVQEALLVNLYPNPASDKLTISFSITKDESISYSIFDVSGKKLLNNYINSSKGSNELHIDLSGLNNGMYYLRFNSGELNTTKRFVKN